MNTKRKGINRYFKILVMLLMLSPFTLNLNAQAAAQADNSNYLQLNTSFKIVLNESAEVNETYILDVSKLSFQNSEQLQNFCEIFSSRLHSLSADYSSRKITMNLNKDFLEGNNMSIADVNAHFDSLSARMVYIYNKIN